MLVTLRWQLPAKSSNDRRSDLSIIRFVEFPIDRIERANAIVLMDK